MEDFNSPAHSREIRDSDGITAAARDVLAERARQISVEGWTPKHDDRHDLGELAMAAGCYALAAGLEHRGPTDPRLFKTSLVSLWPWAWSWWKPRTARENLVRAAALILADIERMDRAGSAGDHPADA